LQASLKAKRLHVQAETDGDSSRITSALRSAACALGLGALALTALGSCSAVPPTGDAAFPIAAVELLFQETRELRDAIDVTRSRGATATSAGVALTEVTERYNGLRALLERALVPSAAPPLSEEDERALQVMRRALEKELVEEKAEPEPASSEVDVDCAYDAQRVAQGEDGYAALSKRTYACFSLANYSLSFEGETLNRATILGLLTLTDDPSRRKGLWMALAPLWRVVNGGSGPRSPYRTLVRMNAARLQAEGKALGESVRGIGVEPAVMEEWLTLVLQKWHDITPDAPAEPWDFSYNAGRGNRALREAISLESLRSVNDRFYRDLGADPVALQVQYDLEPRASKDPVAFTTFGRRPRLGDAGVTPGEPWVFASYQVGGLDNLLELLHETGHAVHIAAIRTRPAFADWPDSDIFTEGVADIATHEMYEPAWQQRYLGASVSVEENIAAKYAGVYPSIVMDIAWALFEVRMHRESQQNPNQVWTEITQKYLRIEPHPDLAWWAVRGQLVDSPGYMMNYAAGAILNADLRARARELYGSYTEGDPGWYQRISASLYRFGLERASKDVIEDFLGRPVSPQALLDDMGRVVASNGVQSSARSAADRAAQLAAGG
jgi:hypothetical protein